MLYGNEYTSDDDGAGYSSSFYLERQLEFWASLIEVFAAFGWIWSWHVEYIDLISRVPGPIPSKGWCVFHTRFLFDIYSFRCCRTFDDPDLSANITIAAAAIVYFTYNCQVIRDYDAYETNKLYQLGDQLYLINSIFYFLAAMRDCGWFWFMPAFGQYRTVRDIMMHTQPQVRLHDCFSC